MMEGGGGGGVTFTGVRRRVESSGGVPPLVPGWLRPGRPFPLYIPLAGCWRLADEPAAAPAGRHRGEARAQVRSLHGR